MPFGMAANNESGWMSPHQSYGLDPFFSSEEEDVSSAIAASLDNRKHNTSELQKAILMSLEERNKMEIESDQSQAQPENGSLVKATKNKLEEEHRKATKVRNGIAPNIKSRIQEIQQMRSFELPLLYDSSGDTLVFVDPPDQQPEQDNVSYDRCTAHYQMPMCVKKDVLMKYGASYFGKMFEATNQHRMPRRRGLVGKLPLHVKYVIDLTPPIEGDQAAYLMTELCCSDGVRNWYHATRRWEVSKSLVAGQDEYMMSWKVNSGTKEQSLESYQSSQILLEYSPVRHRSAIERVLLALHDHDPQLDSAPKVWTTFAVAKYFGITHSPLTDYIVRWLRAPPNSCFLEVLPETALRIADGLQCHPLCRDTFAILVGEEALGAAYRSRVPEFDSALSVHGRKKEQLPEGMKTAVEYASKALSDRVNAEFASLIDDGMRWIDNLPEFQKFSKLGPLPETLGQDLKKLIILLKAYVRGAVCTVLCTEFPYLPNRETGIPGDDLFPRNSWQEIWAKLAPSERIMTRSFWNILQWCDLFSGPTNLDIQVRLDNGSKMTTRGDAQNAICEKLTFDKVVRNDVLSLILLLKDQYFGSYGTFAEGRRSNGGGNAEIGATSSSLPPSYRSFNETSLKAESEYGSTENLLSNDKESDLFRELLIDYSKDEKNDSSEKAIRKGSSSDFDDEELASLPQAFERLEIYLNPFDFFHFSTFCMQAEAHLKSLSSRMMAAPDVSVRTQGLEVRLTRTLVCLTNSEWKYLPMWAGGNDDGSGGVFADDVPFSHDGFTTAGPKVITAKQYSMDSNSTGSSSFSVISHSGTSHPNTSLLNHNGFSDPLPRGITVSNDGESWASSSAFESYDVVEADKEAHNVQVMLDNMEIEDTTAAQNEERVVKSAKLDEDFDDIFAYSSEEEADDDGDTINGDNLSEMDVNDNND